MPVEAHRHRLSVYYPTTWNAIRYSERLVADRSCMSGAPAQRLPVDLTGAAHVGAGDVGERDQLELSTSISTRPTR